MSRNSMFYVVIALALAILAALTIRTAVATSSVVSVGYGDYDEVERVRATFAKVPADTSYDEVERMRAQFQPSKSADASYDEVERARAGFQPGGATDLSDYWLRHRDLMQRMTQPDLSDYALRHPELIHPAAPDLSDWFQRHPESIH